MKDIEEYTFILENPSRGAIVNEAWAALKTAVASKAAAAAAKADESGGVCARFLNISNVKVIN